MGIREQVLRVLEGLAFLRVQDPTDAQSNVTPAQQEKKTPMEKPQEAGGEKWPLRLLSAWLQRRWVSRAHVVFNCSIYTVASKGERTFSPNVCKAPCRLVMLYKYISNK